MKILSLDELQTHFEDKYCKTGRVKPAVFPVPVCADAKISLPSKIGKIAFSCIGDGLVYPFSLIAFNNI